MTACAGNRDIAGHDGGTCSNQTCDSSPADRSPADRSPADCSPADCSGHGKCTSGVCSCSSGYAGSGCDTCAAGYTGYPSCTQSGNKPTAFYVSPSGNNTNDGTSPSSPFGTLEKARDAMRASSIKTTYVMGGTYLRTAPLTLGYSDSGQSWLGYPGQTPVLDGQNSVAIGINLAKTSASLLNHITIRWLTIQNYTQYGIKWDELDSVTIDSNTIKHITSTAWGQSGIGWMCAGTRKMTNLKITHNLVQDLGYSGIALGVNGNDCTGLVVQYNAVYDYMKKVADGGGIYWADRGHGGIPITIDNNIVGNHTNNVQSGAKHIYLDDNASYVTARNNILFGPCQWPIQIHGGDHNTIQNNIFDITSNTKLGLYQETPQTFGMAGNSFFNNIVYSSTAKSAALWDWYVKASGVALPSVHDNDYWQTNDAAMPNTGKIIDSSPLKINPNFVNAANHDYRFQSGPPMPAFVPFDASTVGPLPNPPN